MAIRKNIDNSFHFGVKKYDLLLTNEALQYYREHQLDDDNWLYEEEGLPVFLDTNVLLDLYRTSIRARDLFITFIEKNASRIIITGQIQQEFMKHRVDKILEANRKNKSVKDELNKLVNTIENIHTEVITRLNQWDNRSDTARDLKNVRVSLAQVKKYIQDNDVSDKDDFKKLIQDVRGYIEPDFKDLEEKLVTEENDKVLDSISKTQILETLTEAEKSFIFNLYDVLWTKALKYETRPEVRDIYAFPGRGDHTKKDEGEDPCGDLYIYHEILAYMEEHDTDAIFLTGDVTKSDWIKANNQPYVQYIIDSYANTNHVIHIRNYREYNFGINAGSDEIETADANENSSPVNVNNVSVPEQNSKDLDESHVSQETANLEVIRAILQHQEESPVQYRWYISEDVFMRELRKSIRWAESYGNGYISKNFFIHDILGNKGYDIDASFRVMEKLVNSNRIEIVSNEVDGHKFNSIQIVGEQETDRQRESHSSNSAVKRTRNRKVTSAKTITQEDIDRMNQEDNL